MLLKMANDDAENVVDEANKNTAAIESPKMTQAEFEKELQDKLEEEKAKEAKKEECEVKADPKVLGSYVVPNRVKDCGKYFDLDEAPAIEEKAAPIPLIESKFNWSKFDWMANEMPAIKKEFGNDVFVKLRLILQRVFGYDVENIFWKDTKIVYHKVQRDEVGNYDIVSYIQVGFSYITDADNNCTKATKKLLLEKKWFTLFTVDDLHIMSDFSDGSAD